MIRFLELLIALLIVAALFVLVGLFLPSSRYVEHSVETNRPLRQVFDTLNGFRRFHEWHPLRAHDPRIEFRLEGPDRGEGARLVYQSRDKRIGTGVFEIIESAQDEHVVMAVENERYGENKRHVFTLRERNKTVQITWGYHVDYGWNLFGRYAGMYVQRTVGDDIKMGLANLVSLLATMPNFDYKALEIDTVVVEPVNLVYASKEADRNITAVENAMAEALATLRRAVRDNKLEQAGPVRLITTNFGSEKYEFDVAIPVRRPGEEAAPADAPLADAPAPAAVEPIEGLKLPEGVEQGVGYSGRALRAHYVGHPAALPLVRDMLRSYAAAHGEEIHDRAFEEYLTDIEDTAAEEAEFNVYWPIKGAPQAAADAVPAQAPAAAPADAGAPADDAAAAEPAPAG